MAIAPMNGKLIVVVKELKEVPDGFTPIEAVPGTAAHEYIADITKLETMVTDPRYIGSFIESYGYLSIFLDGSCLKTEIASAEERIPISIDREVQ